jgi:hypothetical protein
MLDLSQTRIYDSVAFPLNATSDQFEDGTPLVGVLNSSGFRTAALNTTPANTDIFIGAAYEVYTTPTQAPVVQTVTVPSSAPYTVVLNSSPIAGSISIVYANATGTQFTSETTVAGITAAGQYNLTGNLLTFDSADAGANVIVTYLYAPTVQQALALVGTGNVGSVYPSNVTNTIGLIQHGIVFTSNFDASVNWFSATSLVVANGMFTSGKTGGAINGYVYAAPSVASPFLGVYFRA